MKLAFLVRPSLVYYLWFMIYNLKEVANPYENFPILKTSVCVCRIFFLTRQIGNFLEFDHKTKNGRSCTHPSGYPEEVVSLLLLPGSESCSIFLSPPKPPSSTFPVNPVNYPVILPIYIYFCLNESKLISVAFNQRIVSGVSPFLFLSSKEMKERERERDLKANNKTCHHS